MFLPRLGSARACRRAPLLDTLREHREPFQAGAHGGLRGKGNAAGVARWRQIRDAATRESPSRSKCNPFARRRELGEGVAGAGRGAGERSEVGRGDYARSAMLASGRAQTPSRTENAHEAGWHAKRDAGPKGSHARSEPWEPHGGGGGHDGRNARRLCRACGCRRPEAPTDAGAEPHRRAEAGKP